MRQLSFLAFDVTDAAIETLFAEDTVVTYDDLIEMQDKALRRMAFAD
jgi:hypothetical protein